MRLSENMLELLGGLTKQEKVAAGKLAIGFTEFRRDNVPKICDQEGVSADRWDVIADAAIALMLRAFEKG